MIVDAHLHVWELSSPRYPWNPLATVAPSYAWPVERQVDVMDRYGIDRGILVQPSMYRWDNRYLLECAARFGDRFRLVGLVDPQSEDAVKTMRELAAQGVRGLRLGPMLRPDISWYNSPLADRIWNAAADLGLVVTLLILPEHLPEARQAIARFPKTRVLIDHLARPDKAARSEDLDGLYSLAEFERVSVKVSALGFLSKQPYPHEDILAIVRRIYACYGPERMLWGTDTPMSQAPEGLPAALKLIDLALPDAPVEHRDLIKGGAALRLFRWNA